MAFSINIVIYLFLLMMSAVPAVFLNSEIGYIPLLLLLTLFFLSFIYTLLLRLCFRYRCVSLDKIYFRDTENTLAFEVKNRGILLFPRVTMQLTCGDTATPVTFSLPPFGSRVFEMEVRFRHIGRVDAGLRAVKIFDLLGLFAFAFSDKKMMSVPVYPRMLELDRDNETRPGDASARYARRADVEMIYNGVREYEPGDPIKTIHWKLSAHARTYMTRIFDGTGKNPLSVFMDFSPPGFSAEEIASVFDCIVESALSEAYTALKLGVTPELCYFKDGKACSLLPDSLEDLTLAARRFTDFALREDRHIEELIELNRSNCAERVIVCTANLAESVADELLVLQAEGKKAVLIFIAAEGYDPGLYETMLSDLEKQGVFPAVITSVEQLGADDESTGSFYGEIVT